jgi:general nucleoside transport system permease protein
MDKKENIKHAKQPANKAWTLLKKYLHIIPKSLKQAFIRTQPSLIAVVIGLLAGIIVMLIFNPEMMLWGLRRLLLGGFNHGFSSFGTMLHQSMPIILTGLSVVFAFRTGLFNIGASGQMMIAAYVTVHVGVLWGLPAPLHWIVGITLGTIAGALYGMIPGILKAYRNVNEVVASIMLNWIAANLLVWLIGEYVLAPSGGHSANMRSSALLPYLGRNLFNQSQLTIGFLFAVLMAFFIHMILYKTTLGFKLRASGFSIEGSLYAGMNTKKNIITAMTISGALAGLAGSLLFSTWGRTIPRTVAVFREGFEGISVALLGLGEPIGALIAGIFLSHIKTGGYYMQPHFKPEIADMIIGVIIYSTAISVSLQLLIKRYRQSLKKKFSTSKLKREDL